MEMDLTFIDSWFLPLDFIILLKTLGTVLKVAGYKLI